MTFFYGEVVKELCAEKSKEFYQFLEQSISHPAAKNQLTDLFKTLFENNIYDFFDTREEPNKIKFSIELLSPIQRNLSRRTLNIPQGIDFTLHINTTETHIEFDKNGQKAPYEDLSPFFPLVHHLYWRQIHLGIDDLEFDTPQWFGLFYPLFPGASAIRSIGQSIFKKN